MGGWTEGGGWLSKADVSLDLIRTMRVQHLSIELHPPLIRPSSLVSSLSTLRSQQSA
jgi:hypothetical protein